MAKKIWAYFKVKNEEGNPCYPMLYAIAVNKEDRKIFTNFRNMKLFKEVKFDSVKDMIKQNQRIKDCYGEYVLRIAELRTPNLFGVMSTIQIQLTWKEEEEVCLYHSRLCERITSKDLPEPHIFKKPYNKALKTLGYDSFYKLVRLIRTPLKSYIKDVEQDFMIEEYREDIDEFKIFMLLYGYTVKG